MVVDEGVHGMEQDGDNGGPEDRIEERAQKIQERNPQEDNEPKEKDSAHVVEAEFGVVVAHSEQKCFLLIC